MHKIAIIQRFLPSQSRGGVGHFTHGLANVLCRRGHRVTIFSQDTKPEKALYNVVTLPASGKFLGIPTAPLSFPFQIARLDYSPFDLIHAQGDEQFIRRSVSPPVIRTMHGSSFAEALHNGWHGRSPKRFLLHTYFYLGELIAALRADVVAMVSNDTGRYFFGRHPVIGNGVEIEQFIDQSYEKSLTPSILFVGEIKSRKRGDMLVECFLKEVLPVLPDAELWLVSPDAPLEKGLKQFIRPDDKTLAELFARAWLFCLPSSYEGFGRPYVEALAAGTTVVATSNPGANEVLDNGRYGLIVDDKELGKTLIRLLQDDTARRDFEGHGRERALIYAWEQVAEQYERIYDAVLRKRAAQECAA